MSNIQNKNSRIKIPFPKSINLNSDNFFFWNLEFFIRNLKIITIFAPSNKRNQDFADMVKLVDMPDLGSGAARRVGSSPIIRTESPNASLDFFYLKKQNPLIS